MLSQMFKIFKCYGEEFNLNLNSLERTFGLCIWMPSLTNLSNYTLEKKSFQGRPKTKDYCPGKGRRILTYRRVRVLTILRNCDGWRKVEVQLQICCVGHVKTRTNDNIS